ncbi:unnamed protein product [Microthlaspi erraticum]|uniref:Uncharacterized protein n=1 Tax=Microthlaspi erraticum TaxID=1685480 RepID=A0A6D2JML5_9BRAS|nr:unnamed protein product [Microthlaspi erraticum]
MKKTAKPNLARSAPALGLNCADWASKTASGRPRRSDGRSGRSAGQSGLWPSRNGRGRMFGRPAWSDGWIGRWKSRPDAGRSFPGSDGVRAVVRESCAAARRYFPARALVVRGWRGRCGVADRGLSFPGRDRDRPSGFLAETSDGRIGFGRARNIRSSASRTAGLGADSR